MLWAATNDTGAPPYIQVIYWGLAITFTAAAGLLGSRCVLSARSPMAHFVDKFVPDAVGLEEAAFLMLAIYLPAVLLTLLLRHFGIRGQ